MTVQELIKALRSFKPNAKVFVGADEELNTLYSGVRVDALTDANDRVDTQVVIYGLSGTEQD